VEQLNQQTQLLQKQLKQSEEKTRANDEQLTVKTAEMYVKINDLIILIFLSFSDNDKDGK
jgi:hypothetical protein